MNIALPKWPALLVQGDCVTPEQAAEILIRTDAYFPDFLGAGNDRKLGEQLSLACGWIQPYEARHKPEYYEGLDKAREAAGVLNLEYLSNRRIVSSWIGGPHGWCNWDGTIGCDNYNIGKWPSIEEVEHEWALIAEAFPFLSLTSQLLSGEVCEEGTQPLVEFKLYKGQVVTCEPTKQLMGVDNSALKNYLEEYPNVHESGISPDRLAKLLRKVK